MGLNPPPPFWRCKARAKTRPHEHVLTSGNFSTTPGGALSLLKKPLNHQQIDELLVMVDERKAQRNCNQCALVNLSVPTKQIEQSAYTIRPPMHEPSPESHSPSDVNVKPHLYAYSNFARIMWWCPG
eukprot:3109722-Pyramimonas_sp.AAC.1